MYLYAEKYQIYKKLMVTQEKLLWPQKRTQYKKNKIILYKK